MALLIAFTVFLSVDINTNTKTVFAVTSNNNVEQLCRQYTDSIAPNGINFNEYINDFYSVKNTISGVIGPTFTTPRPFKPSSIYDNNAHYYTVNYGYVNVYGDDNITNLVPKQLFTYSNKTLFIGKSYGFMIVTEYENNHGFISTVILIEVNKSINDYLADVCLTVKATLDFAYIDRLNNQRTLYKNPNLTVETSKTLKFSLQNDIDSAVVPLFGFIEKSDAVGEKEYHFQILESEKYLLGDISFAAQVRNHNSYNITTNTTEVKNLKARMGNIVGHLQNGTMSENCRAVDSDWSSGKIKDKTYCFQNANCRIGWMQGTIV